MDHGKQDFVSVKISNKKLIDKTSSDDVRHGLEWQYLSPRQLIRRPLVARLYREGSCQQVATKPRSVAGHLADTMSIGH
ncbi:hypothetical protein E4U21_000934 [Claviceps maximensis]|nr:hypothetical protein E4U21_000934 [Claviceps maximensis]